MGVLSAQGQDPLPAWAQKKCPDSHEPKHPLLTIKKKNLRYSFSSSVTFHPIASILATSCFRVCS